MDVDDVERSVSAVHRYTKDGGERVDTEQRGKNHQSGRRSSKGG